MSSGLVVVIVVGVIIVAITASAVSGVEKPATRPEPDHRDPSPAPLGAPAIDWGMPEAAPEDEGEPEPERGLLQRLRAAGLLTVAIVALGAAAAAVLGVAIVLGARAVDGALG